MWLLQSHYSQPIDYSEEILEEKRRSYERLVRLYRQISDSEGSSELSDALAAELRARFDAAMRDDFNTPEAVAAVFEAASRAGREISNHPKSAGKFSSLVQALQEVLTIFGFDLEEDLATGIRVGGEAASTASMGTSFSVEVLKIPKEILEKVRLRDEARQEKNWPLADRLRDELHAEGWAIEDTPEGPVLSRR
jgi:cysteinyl-tRNA synthetase